MTFKSKSFRRAAQRPSRGAVAATLSLACLAAAPAAMASASWSATHTDAFVPEGAKSLGLLSNGEQIHVVLGLTLRNRDALETFVGNLTKAGNPAYHQFLTPAQFTAQYSPTEKQAKAVVDYLTAAGFRNVTLAPNRLLVSADGTAATVRSAFSTELAAYDYNGRRVFANTLPAKVPAALGGTVLSVIGLQNAQQGHTLHQKYEGATTTAVTGFAPTQFAQLYDAANLPTALTVPVAIFAQGSLTQTLADFAQFETTNGIPATPTTVIPVNGGSSDTSGTPEWDLDSQDIIGITGGVKSLTFYAGPSLSYTDMNTEFNQIVTDNLTPVINVSIGGCEISAKATGATATSDQIFLQATSQGQSFFISTGDSGSAECGKVPGQSWPAISPYVVAVGGTSLVANSSGGYGGETVWSGAGGGPSVTEAEPPYQTSAGVVPQKSRGVPDLSFDANPNTGSKIIVNGSIAQYGGTSLAAPLATGGWARLIASCNCGPTLGFVTPLLYEVIPSTPSIIHDVTSGNNGKYTATTGWDYASGFGSLDIGASAQ